MSKKFTDEQLQNSLDVGMTQADIARQFNCHTSTVHHRVTNIRVKGYLPQNKTTIKRLFLDIETSLMTVASFSLWPKYIPIDNIITDWYIISAAWKWEGDNTVHSISSYTNNDYHVVKALREAICNADELVYHNGHKFDYKKLNARVILNGLPPMDKPRQTDTYIQCKRHFAFTSNKLDYVAKALGLPSKTHTGNDLWLRCLKGDKEAIDQMHDYNRNDVLVLEAVFGKLRPHIDVGYNSNIAKTTRCTHCNSTNFESRGNRFTKTCMYKRYVCNNCYGWFSGNKKLHGATAK